MKMPQKNMFNWKTFFDKHYGLLLLLSWTIWTAFMCCAVFAYCFYLCKLGKL